LRSRGSAAGLRGRSLGSTWRSLGLRPGMGKNAALLAQLRAWRQG
jgi:hypothetical protein